MASLLAKKEVKDETPEVIEGFIMTPFKRYPDGKVYYGKPFESTKGFGKSANKRVGKQVGKKIETKNAGSFEL